MAAVRTGRQRVTYADLERMPDDGRRYELYDGEVSVVPSPLLRHQRAAERVFELLREYSSRHGGEAIVAPIDIVFSDLDVVHPDVVFFGASRTHVLHPDRPIRAASDLVVEVLSPGTEATDRGRKMRTLARYGAPEYWLVDTYERRIEIYRLSGGQCALERRVSEDEDVRSATLPNLTFPAARLFTEP